MHNTIYSYFNKSKSILKKPILSKINIKLNSRSFSTSKASLENDTNSKKDRDLSRITWMGALLDLALAVLKGFAGVFGNSSALVADAFHSLSDLASDFVAIFALKVSSKPPDSDHPFGHGKFESLGSLSLAAILIGTGAGVGVHAFNLLTTPCEAILIPSAIALIVSIVAILSKEGMYHATIHFAKKYNSNLVLANAWHHRSDAFTSLVAMVGIVGAQYGVTWMDPFAALFVSGMIIKVGVETGISAVADLTDTQSDPEMISAIEKALRSVEGVIDTHNIRVRKMGAYLVVDVHMIVPGYLSVSAAHLIADKARYKALQEVKEVSDLMVHVDVGDDQSVTETSKSNYYERIMDDSIVPSPLFFESKVKKIASEDNRIQNIISTMHYVNNVIRVCLTVTVSDPKYLSLDTMKSITSSLKDKILKSGPISIVEVSFLCK